MIRQLILFLTLLIVSCIVSVASARAQQSIAAAVNKQCEKELSTYCKGVTLGEGRIASCLYAYEDHLSLACAEAVYDGIMDLQAATANLEVFSRKCASDLLRHCGSVVPGQARLYQCLVENQSKLNDDCSASVKAAEPDMRRLGLLK